MKATGPRGARRGLEASFLDAASAGVYSFYHVAGTVPGRSIDLRAVFTGETVTILERAGSRSIEPGTLVYALMVTVEGMCLQLGMAPEHGRVDTADLRRKLGL